MKKFGGRILFLDRDDINTDEIIPAKYLTVLSKDALSSHLLEDLALPGFDPGRDIAGKGVLVTRANFGCGSSREHAPWALEANGIYAVIAESFARIFRQNMYNCGMLAIELPKEDIERIIGASRDAACVITTYPPNIVITSEDKISTWSFVLNGFDRDLIQAGGWLDYAHKKYG
ncbi:MAG: 3-isopropylmalate dehydratase small subunit [Spirochaetota bacterium]|jgi:3-isopropylmalate/(R)-2-methylmalate dehydratase small subunit|nr:3-isopropylmalate dehydratase small subunit [Spirochaetota bacterium]